METWETERMTHGVLEREVVWELGSLGSHPLVLPQNCCEAHYLSELSFLIWKMKEGTGTTWLLMCLPPLQLCSERVACIFSLSMPPPWANEDGITELSWAQRLGTRALGYTSHECTLWLLMMKMREYKMGFKDKDSTTSEKGSHLRLKMERTGSYLPLPVLWRGLRTAPQNSGVALVSPQVNKGSCFVTGGQGNRQVGESRASATPLSWGKGVSVRLHIGVMCLSGPCSFWPFPLS